MQIPVINLRRVLHVGTMDAGAVGKNYESSHEGRCLSVSLCPHAWEAIARLGGNDLHELRSEGGSFLDMHALAGDEEARMAVLDWATGRGLLADREVWKHREWDTYSRRWTMEYKPSAEAALAAANRTGRYASIEEVPGPRGQHGIEAVTMPVATPELERVSGMRCMPFASDAVQVDPGDHLHAVLMAWAIEEAPELLGRPLDGVWWRDPHSPARLSAPRGAIFPDRVPDWEATRIEWDAVSDRREMRAMPDTELVEPARAFAP